MNALSMVQTASILLVLTAAGGVGLAMWRFLRKDNPPHWLAMVHGFLAAGTFTLLFYVLVVEGLEPIITIGVLSLGAAAVGGLVLNLAFHLAGRLLPAWLVHVHIALGAVGTGLVLWKAWWL